MEHDDLGLSHNASVVRKLREVGEAPEVLFSARGAAAVVHATEHQAQVQLQQVVVFAASQSVWVTLLGGATLIRVFYIEVVAVTRYADPPVLCIKADHWDSDVCIVLQCEGILRFAEVLLGHLPLDVPVTVRRKLSDDGISVQHDKRKFVSRHALSAVSQFETELAQQKPSPAMVPNQAADPATGLPVVLLPPEVQGLYPPLERSVVHHCEEVGKVSSKGRQQRRILVITSSSFYVIDLSRGKRGITRCTDIHRIAQVFVHSSGLGGLMAFKVPHDGFDSVFKSTKHAAICNILTTISRVRHGRQLQVVTWDVTETRPVHMGVMVLSDVQFYLQKPSEYRVRMHSPDIERAVTEDMYGARSSKALLFNATHQLTLQPTGSPEVQPQLAESVDRMEMLSSHTAETTEPDDDCTASSEIPSPDPQSPHEVSAEPAAVPPAPDVHMPREVPTPEAARRVASLPSYQQPPSPEPPLPVSERRESTMEVRENVVEALKVASVLLMQGQHEAASRFLTSCAAVMQDGASNTNQLLDLAVEAQTVPLPPRDAEVSPSDHGSLDSSVPPSDEPPPDTEDDSIRADSDRLVALPLPLETRSCGVQVDLLSPRMPTPSLHDTADHSQQTEAVRQHDNGCDSQSFAPTPPEEPPLPPATPPCQQEASTPPSATPPGGRCGSLRTVSSTLLMNTAALPDGPGECQGTALVAWDVCATWHTMQLVLGEGVLSYTSAGGRHMLLRMAEVVKIDPKASLTQATLPPAKSRTPWAVVVVCRSLRRYYLVFDLPADRHMWARSLLEALKTAQDPARQQT